MAEESRQANADFSRANRGKTYPWHLRKPHFEHGGTRRR